MGWTKHVQIFNAINRFFNLQNWTWKSTFSDFVGFLYSGRWQIYKNVMTVLFSCNGGCGWFLRSSWVLTAVLGPSDRGLLVPPALRAGGTSANLKGLRGACQRPDITAIYLKTGVPENPFPDGPWFNWPIIQLRYLSWRTKIA